MSVAARQKQTQDRNLERLLTMERSRADYDAQSRIISTFQNAPGARAVWPMSALGYTNPRGLDVSGNENHLSTQNSPDFGFSGLVPYVRTDGINQYLSRPDGGAANWADIRGNETYVLPANQGLTLCAWVRPLTVGAAQHIIGKWGAAGQRSYRLLLNAADTVSAQISTDGTAVVVATSTATLSADTWHFVVLQYDPSTKLSVWIDGVEVANAAGIPATIFDSTAAFTIAASAAPGSYFNADISICGLYVMHHSDAIIPAMRQQSRAEFGV